MLGLVSLLLNLLLLPVTIIRREAARWLRALLEAGRWLFFLALALACAGATLVTGGIVLLVAVFFGYISLFAAVVIYFGSSLGLTIAFYCLAQRARNRVFEAFESEFSFRRRL
jgi:hypothetical protein